MHSVQLVMSFTNFLLSSSRKNTPITLVGCLCALFFIIISISTHFPPPKSRWEERILGVSLWVLDIPVACHLFSYLVANSSVDLALWRLHILSSFHICLIHMTHIQRVKL
jgi:hypothetical protein